MVLFARWDEPWDSFVREDEDNSGKDVAGGEY